MPLGCGEINLSEEACCAVRQVPRTHCAQDAAKAAAAAAPPAAALRTQPQQQNGGSVSSKRRAPPPMFSAPAAAPEEAASFHADSQATQVNAGGSDLQRLQSDASFKGPAGDGQSSPRMSAMMLHLSMVCFHGMNGCPACVRTGPARGSGASSSREAGAGRAAAAGAHGDSDLRSNGVSGAPAGMYAGVSEAGAAASEQASAPASGLPEGFFEATGETHIRLLHCIVVVHAAAPCCACMGVPTVVLAMMYGHAKHAAASEPESSAAAPLAEEPSAAVAALPAGFFEVAADPGQDTAYQEEAQPGPAAPPQAPAVEDASATALPKGGMPDRLQSHKEFLERSAEIDCQPDQVFNKGACSSMHLYVEVLAERGGAAGTHLVPRASMLPRQASSRTRARTPRRAARRPSRGSRRRSSSATS